VRLLVCGGAGFVGSAFVVRRLGASRDEIVVLDKLTYAGTRANLSPAADDPVLAPRLRFVQGDICDAALVRELVAEADAVVNFAAESHVDRSLLDAQAFLHTGVEGVHVLLEGVRDTGRHVRFVQVSTDEVYGPRSTGASTEDDPLLPSSPYAAAKAAGDLVVGAYRISHDLDTVITRGPNTYGPRQHPEKLVALCITNSLENAQVPLYGAGTQLRAWLHVDDHADAIAHALDHGATGATYNIGGGEQRTNLDMVELVLNLTGKPLSLVRHVSDRAGHDSRYALDGSRLAALGWQPRLSLADGLPETVSWYEQNADWWRHARSGDWDAYYERQYGWRLAESTSA
jgi:dTDP-glucose 4,6-dehydratase